MTQGPNNKVTDAEPQGENVLPQSLNQLIAMIRSCEDKSTHFQVTKRYLPTPIDSLAHPGRKVRSLDAIAIISVNKASDAIVETIFKRMKLEQENICSQRGQLVPADKIALGTKGGRKALAVIDPSLLVALSIGGLEKPIAL